MSDLDLSRSAKALLNAAKSDGPSAAARAKIWGGVASGAGAAGAVGAGVAAGVGAAGAGAAGAGALGSGALGAGGASTFASAGATAGAAAAGASIGAGAVVASGGGKLLAMGALFGSALTVGIAATLLGIGRSPSLMPDPQYGEPSSMVDPAYTNGGAVHPSGAAANAFGCDSSEARRSWLSSANRADTAGNGALTDTPTIGSASSPDSNGVANRGANSDSNGGATHREPASNGAPAAVRVVREDSLMRESALVAEARGALMRGDSKTALAALKAAKTLKHRELEPEELSLEAKALRAVGRDGDAASLEIVLKSRYPDHALAR